jgi:hypothetical protein
MKRLMLRGTAVGIVIATFIAAGALGATAIRNKTKADDAAANRAARAADSLRSRNDAATTVDSSAARTVAVTPAPTPSRPAASPAVSPAAAAPRAAATTRPAAALRPVIPMGQSALPDSVTALRSDSEVVVSFDLMMVRTRRAQKFEQFVRATLPLIYGRGASDALAKIPDGGLAAQGDLLEELPKKGLRIPGAGWMIRLFPETRPGQDGPLVVRYRASVAPGGD